MGNDLLIIYIGIITLLIAVFNVILYKKVVSDLFEPTTWFVAFLVVFFLPQVFLNSFKFHYYTSFLIFAGSLFFVLGYYVNSYRFYYRLNWFHYNYHKPLIFRKFIVLGIVLAGLSFLIVLLKVRSHGLSLSEYLLNMFLFHAEYGKKGGYIWMILTNPVKYLLFISIFRYLDSTKKSRKKFIVVGFVVLLYLIGNLSASRWAYISMIFLLLPLLYFIFVRKRPYFKLYFLLIGLLIFPIMIFLNVVRQNGVERAISYTKEKGVIELGIESLQGDTNPGKNFQYLVHYLDETGDYHYGKYLATQFLFAIPRKIWSGKPKTSLCFVYTEKVMKEDPIADGTTYTFTFFDFYAILGLPSLCLFTFLVGAFCRFLYTQLYACKLNYYWLAFSIPFILNITNYFRGSFQDSIAFIMLDLLIIYAIYKTYKYFKIIR